MKCSTSIREVKITSIHHPLPRTSSVGLLQAPLLPPPLLQVCYAHIADAGSLYILLVTIAQAGKCQSSLLRPLACLWPQWYWSFMSQSLSMILWLGNGREAPRAAECPVIHANFLQKAILISTSKETNN